jgi:hypothetical protein
MLCHVKPLSNTYTTIYPPCIGDELVTLGANKTNEVYWRVFSKSCAQTPAVVQERDYHDAYHVMRRRTFVQQCAIMFEDLSYE